MGIILNQPTSLSIYELLNIKPPEAQEDTFPAVTINSGGPVDTDHGFILHDSHAEYDSSIQVTENLFLTSSTDILDDIANGVGPNNTLIVLGYAGWSAGQLEAEISANSWLTIDYQAELVFSTPADQQWHAAGNLLGIDLNLMSSQTGHA